MPARVYAVLYAALTASRRRTVLFAVCYLAALAAVVAFAVRGWPA